MVASSQCFKSPSVPPVNIKLASRQIASYSRTSMTQTLMAHLPGLARTIIMVPTGHFMHNLRTSMTRTLIAHLPGLARTIIMVPTGHFMHNLPWMAGTTLG